jgi:antirestriction protein ArdC
MRSTDLFERITRQIADAIEAGAGDFRMPWHRWGEATAQPINAVSRRPYRGINMLLLWAAAEIGGYSSGRWGTFRQWSEAGAQVRKGEKATAILFWKTTRPEASGAARDEDDGGDKPRFVARAYFVFNEEQVDGASPPVSGPGLSPAERIAEADAFLGKSGADVRHGGDRACYASNIDQIWLPRFEQFREPAGYYSTFAHELVHWSGAAHRLNRDLEGRFGSESYAMEELVAELGAAFVAAHLRIAVEPRPDHAAYIASWLKVLRRDPKAIVAASAKAQEALDYLISFQHGGSPDRTGGSVVEQLAA